MSTGHDLQRRASRRLPGIPEPEPGHVGPRPLFIARSKGAETWDVDGRRYVDMSTSGTGCNVLGFADPEVEEAVVRAVHDGPMASVLQPADVELADLLCELHPWADMVRYARAGSDATSLAIRIARTYTNRERVAFCGYHSWHDWYMSAGHAQPDAIDRFLQPGFGDAAGVPRAAGGLAVPFHYNDASELEQVLRASPGRFAAVILEPVRNTLPEPGFLARVRELASEHGAVLIADEVMAGFRLGPGGAHLAYGIEPDLAVFSKAISNGHPMSAVIGREAIMRAQLRTFAYSTYWIEGVGPAAAVATIKKYVRERVHDHLRARGEAVQAGWRAAAARAGLAVKVEGIPPLSRLSFVHDDPARLMDIYGARMAEQGFLAGERYYPTLAHTEDHVRDYLAATERVFHELRAS